MPLKPFLAVSHLLSAHSHTQIAGANPSLLWVGGSFSWLCVFILRWNLARICWQCLHVHYKLNPIERFVILLWEVCHLCQLNQWKCITSIFSSWNSWRFCLKSFWQLNAMAKEQKQLIFIASAQMWKSRHIWNHFWQNVRKYFFLLPHWVERIHCLLFLFDFLAPDTPKTNSKYGNKKVAFLKGLHVTWQHINWITHTIS